MEQGVSFSRAPFCLIFLFSCFHYASPNPEGDALNELRNALVDPNGILQSWDPTLVNPCTWFHVTCNSDNSVTRVDLGNANLTGKLVTQLGQLPNLQYLELYSNHISGTVPYELGNLTNLVSLDLYLNNLSGPIPDTLGKLLKLRFLRLNNNTLHGKIPLSLTGINTLQVLDFSFNGLSGNVPTTGSFSMFTPISFKGNKELKMPVTPPSTIVPTGQSKKTVQAQVHNVLDHIIPPTEEKDIANLTTTKEADPTLWKRLDAAVLQWMYATISPDILNSILVPDDTAEKAWLRIAALFQDNKRSRALHLENQFTSTKLINFPNTTTYCNRLKQIADQLGNVNAPVTNSCLVIRMLSGLTKDCGSFVTHIQQHDPLPSFDTVKSNLALEETTIIQRDSHDTENAAFISQNTSNNRTYNPKNRHPSPPPPPSHSHHHPPSSYPGGRPAHPSGRLNNTRHLHRGRNNRKPHPNQQNWNQHQLPSFWPNVQWPNPPPPYPSQNWTRIFNPPTSNNGHNKGNGILGPGPAHSANIVHEQQPTDINSTFHTLTLNPPDSSWYMDTRATSHMTSNNGFPDGEGPHEM